MWPFPLPQGCKRQTQIKDELDHTTLYEYDSYYSVLNATTNAKGIRTAYSYQIESGRVDHSYIANVAAIHHTYENGRLQQLTRKTFNNNADVDIIHSIRDEVLQVYNFDSNSWGQTKSISVGNTPLVSYEYEDINGTASAEGGNLSKMIYGNGDYAQYSYDQFDRVTQVVYNDGNGNTEGVLTNRYNAEGYSAEVTYGTENEVKHRYFFEYDSSGRIVRSVRFDSGALSLRTEHQYDEFDRLYSQRWFMDGRTHYEQYQYSDGADGDGSLTRYRTPNGQQIHYTYDHLKRLTEASVKDGYGAVHFRTNYAFQDVSGNRTTTLVQYRDVRDSNGELITGYKYAYDALGNITQIRQSEGSENLLYAYTYDDLNQLLTEIHYDGNGNQTASYSYNYDTAGNIRSESKTVRTPTEEDPDKTTTTTKTYTYSNGDWKDLLIGVETDGTTHAISYDASGNPLSYSNGTTDYTNLTWQRGRQLASITTGGKTYTYDYDAEGIRTQKVVDGVTHSYLTLNGKVVRESYPYGSSTVIMHFVYDNEGKPFALLYSTDGGSSFATYHYAVNTQGDVEGIYFTRKNTGTGKQEVHWMGRYTYDAWGNILTITDANGNPPTNPANLMLRNPIRYRGYYYDTETGLYYVSSRYYDPEIGRFINADDVDLLGANGDFASFNLFAYCGNNPVNRVDSLGMFWEEICDWFKKVGDKIEEYLTPSNQYGSMVSGASATTTAIASSLESAIRNSTRPNNIGAGTYAKQCAREVEEVSKFNNRASKFYSVAAYGAAAIDVGIGIYDNINNGSPTKKIIIDAAVDATVTGGSVWAAGALGSSIGTAFGSVCPGAGNLIGAGFGYVAGVGIYILTDMISFNGKTARTWIKEALNSI